MLEYMTKWQTCVKDFKEKSKLTASTLMTSAPCSAKHLAAEGAATTVDKETTRTPVNKGALSLPGIKTGKLGCFFWNLTKSSIAFCFDFAFFFLIKNEHPPTQVIKMVIEIAIVVVAGIKVEMYSILGYSVCRD